MWFKQTIGHACGLIGLLHCITNGEAATHIQVGSDLDKLVKAALPLKMKERADLLYNSDMLEQAHQEAAQTGDSKSPTSHERVGYGFTAFVKGKDGHLWELEGSRKGPLDRGPASTPRAGASRPRAGAWPLLSPVRSLHRVHCTRSGGNRN